MKNSLRLLLILIGLISRIYAYSEAISSPSLTPGSIPSTSGQPIGGQKYNNTLPVNDNSNSTTNSYTQSDETDNTSVTTESNNVYTAPIESTINAKINESTSQYYNFESTNIKSKLNTKPTGKN